jgi:hypothetical protein
MPVKVTDLISTTDPSDTYATHDAAYGKGGFRSVADITARNAITTERKTIGMWCKVLSDGKVYEWDGTTWNEVAMSGGSGSTSTFLLIEDRYPDGYFERNYIIDNQGNRLTEEVRLA